MTTEQRIKVRKVTDWQPTFPQTEPGAEAGHTLQLILDNGAEERVIPLGEGDAANLFDWLTESSEIYFDTENQAFELFDRQLIVRMMSCD